jgi:APA family basic amino acid/polyamine antiporter
MNRGLKESNNFNMIFTYAKVIILVFIIMIALSYFNRNLYDPFFLPEKGFYGTIEGAAILFFAYLGFDVVTTLSDEAKNPLKNIPYAMGISLLICMAVYIMTAFSMCGMS